MADRRRLRSRRQRLRERDLGRAGHDGVRLQRQNGYQSVTLRLADPSALEAFGPGAQRQPAAPGGLRGQNAVLRGSGRHHCGRPDGAGDVRGVIMGIGAVFGAMNTMYAIWSRRARARSARCARWASRAISILSSFMIESTFLALIGGALGCMLALPINRLIGRHRRRELPRGRPSPSASRRRSSRRHGLRSRDGHRRRRAPRLPRGTDCRSRGAARGLIETVPAGLRGNL